MALLWTIVKLSLKNLWSNKLRSFLTMLGIMIGVSSVIAMLALATGAKDSVVQQIQSFGTNTLVMYPEFRHEGGVASENVARLTVDDAKAIISQVPEITAISPAVSTRAQVKFGNRNVNTSVQGIAAAYLPMRNFKIRAGRLFTTNEEEQNRKVAILGHKVIEDLFEGSNDAAIGNEIKVNGVTYTVIGTLQEKGGQGFFNPDDMIFVPYTTVMKRLLGSDYIGELHMQVRDEKVIQTAILRTTALMRKRHRLTSDKEDDFGIFSSTEMLKTFEAMGAIFAALLGGIASVSLLVGGIGIMNIMLVTVTERTREIGIRKALGAKRRDIMNQFLIESLVISLIGGALGVAVGVGMSSLASFLGATTAMVSVRAIAMSLGFCSVIGLFFGLYPARRASRLDPIEALRYE